MLHFFFESVYLKGEWLHLDIFPTKHKGENFCSFLCDYLHTKLPKCSLLKKKKKKKKKKIAPFKIFQTGVGCGGVERVGGGGGGGGSAYKGTTIVPELSRLKAYPFRNAICAVMKQNSDVLKTITVNWIQGPGGWNFSTVLKNVIFSL